MEKIGLSGLSWLNFVHNIKRIKAVKDCERIKQIFISFIKFCLCAVILPPLTFGVLLLVGRCLNKHPAKITNEHPPKQTTQTSSSESSSKGLEPSVIINLLINAIKEYQDSRLKKVKKISDTEMEIIFELYSKDCGTIWIKYERASSTFSVKEVEDAGDSGNDWIELVVNEEQKIATALTKLSESYTEKTIKFYHFIFQAFLKGLQLQDQLLHNKDMEEAEQLKCQIPFFFVEKK